MDETISMLVQSMVRPVKVAIIEIEHHVVEQIKAALSVYNCEVNDCYDFQFGCKCRQSQCNSDLIFLADNITEPKSSLDISTQISICSPNASVVILTRNPQAGPAAALMKAGCYTFLVKNGSFTDEHVRRVFNQLNLRLRDGGTAESVNK